MKVRIASCLVVLLGVATAGWSEEVVLRLEAESSHVGFTLDSTLHTVHGDMVLDHGEIRFDPETGLARGEVVIDATRTDTGNAKRDKKMHHEVLESAKYPEIVYSVEAVRGTLHQQGESDLELSGRVAIHGTTHPVTFLAHVVRKGTRVSASATLPVPYVEWGLEDPSVFVFRAAKEVEVTLDVKGRIVE